MWGFLRMVDKTSEFKEGFEFTCNTYRMTSSTLFPPNFLNTSYIEIAPCNKGAI